jgi:hypothetical protein
MNNMAALESFISQNNISMQLSRIGRGSPPQGEPGNKEAKRYKCLIKRPGKQVNVYVAVPPEEGRLTASDVLFMLILDASGCEMLKGYYGEYQRTEFFEGAEVDVSMFEEFWDEYRSRCHQTQKFRAFLGTTLYNELIVQFGFAA